MPEYESWKNILPGRVVLRKFDAQGKLTDEMVASGKVIHLTPQERRINQENAANEDLDMFRNGFLSPVKLIDDEEDTKELASNPNVMTEESMRDLYKLAPKSFMAKVDEIKNVITLTRLYEVGREVNANIRQLEAVQGRIEVVTPKPEEPQGERKPRAVQL